MSEQKEKIMAAFGGKRGLIDNGLPSTLFLISFLINKDLKLSIYLSVGLSVVLTI